MTDDNSNTIVLWSDIACPWASLALHRLREARSRLGVQHLVLAHRAFPLELINARATPRPVLDHEIEIVVDLVGLDWRPFGSESWEYPGSVLIALEAVQAARFQPNALASEELDWALRQAFYRDSRPIGQLTEVLRIAGEVQQVDVEMLRMNIAAGTGRRRVLEDNEAWRKEKVQGSPVFILPSGRRFHNPGIELEWTPVGEAWELEILRDDPAAVDLMLMEALSSGSKPWPAS